MKRSHTVKILQCWYESITNGSKLCELRKNDRDYQAGDRLAFEVLPHHNSDGDNWFPNDIYEISHVLTSDSCEGLETGYCILSLQRFNDPENE